MPEQASRVALLVVDLEGLVGVDSIASLIVGTEAYTKACNRLTADVSHAACALFLAGYSAVHVCDSHHSGSGETNLDLTVLDARVTWGFTDDGYSESFFKDAAAVACIGMHAPAGMVGFAAHTVDLSARWSCDGMLLSESDIVRNLAAEQGIPLLFVAGDDVLAEHLAPLDVVIAKTSLGMWSAESADLRDVRMAVERAARRYPPPVGPVPSSPIVLTFRTRHQAQLAAAAGAERTGPYDVTCAAESFRDRYECARRASDAASAGMSSAFTGGLGSVRLTDELMALFAVMWPVDPLADWEGQASRALAALLRRTSKADASSRALRALSLHMLQGHAPNFFERHELHDVLNEALVAIDGAELDPSSGPSVTDAMAYVDMLYVQTSRDKNVELPDGQAWGRYLHALVEDDWLIHAWLMAELLRATGVPITLAVGERPMRFMNDRRFDQYWLTHLMLLDTRYLQRPLSHPSASAWTAELMLATPMTLFNDQLDLAGELAFCLQLVGEVASGAHQTILEALAAAQQEDGTVAEPDGDDAHCTAVAVIAFAGAEERRRAAL